MIHWKVVFCFFLCIELVYRLSVFYNSRLAIEPLCLTFIRCPNEYFRTKVHLGWKSISLMTQIDHWYKLLRQCRITEYQIYLFNIIGAIDVILLVLILVNVIQRRNKEKILIQS